MSADETHRFPQAGLQVSLAPLNTSEVTENLLTPTIASF